MHLIIDKQLSFCRDSARYLLVIGKPCVYRLTGAKCMTTSKYKLISITVCLKKPDRYSQHHISSPVHNVHYLFLAYTDTLVNSAVTTIKTF